MSLKQCPNCGNIINSKSGVCSECNAIVNDNTIQSDTIAVVKKQKRPNKNIGLIVACAVMFVVLSVIVIFLVVPTLADRNHMTYHADDEVESTRVRKASQKHTERYVAKKTSKTSKSTNEAAVVTEFLQVGNVSGNCDHDGGVYYYPSNMTDGDVKTCWALDIRESDNYDSEYGFGHIVFDVDCNHLEEIVVYNGYQKNDANFINNPRARHIVMYNADDMSAPIIDAQLKDAKGGQVVKAIGNSANRNISRIIMFFPGDFYYPGKKWNDLSISEIEFWGIGR